MTLDIDKEKQVVTTKGGKVLCRKHQQDTPLLSPCTHEEADTRLMLHVADSVRNGLKKIMVRSVDTDVVVIAISIIHKVDLCEPWIAFGTGKSFRYISVHGIARQLGHAKSQGLLFFHAFTGCDQVSSFANRGKKTAWETWSVMDSGTETFEVLSAFTDQDTLIRLRPQIEWFVILLFDRRSECFEVD